MKRILLSLGLTLGASFTVSADYQMAGYFALEQRYFLQDPAWGKQARSQGSLVLEPELFLDWNEGSDSLVFKPFYRYDQEDDERTHGDIRELLWVHAGEAWEFKTGIGKVFWGQTESLHLVDIINQTDSVEAVDGEDKLGQPMVSASYVGDFGTISGFVLPYFRERTFSGTEGRLRPPVAIDTDNPLYESSDEESHIDFALRWQHTLGDWEVGLSYFDGTSREPLLTPVIDENTLQITGLRPFYPLIKQAGVDILMVDGAWLWKGETIFRQGQGEDFFAAVGGFEYTLVGVLGSDYDIGFLTEYQYDERENSFLATAQNDIMIGTRIAFNDVDSTEWLIGFVQDLDDMETYSAFIEASSRMTDNWKWVLNGYFFSADSEEDPYFFIRRDDHVSFSLEYYF